MFTDEQLKNLPPFVFQVAWWELYKSFGERQQQEEMDLMDGVLQGVALDMKDRVEKCTVEGLLKEFPHLAKYRKETNQTPEERGVNQMVLGVFLIPALIIGFIACYGIILYLVAKEVSEFLNWIYK